MKVYCNVLGTAVIVDKKRTCIGICKDNASKGLLEKV